MDRTGGADGATPGAGRSTTWRPGRPVPLHTILGPLRRGPGDPTTAVRDGMLWRGQQTPHGPATLALRSLPADGEVRARAWGPGADWALAWLPASLGNLDDPTGFAVPRPLAHMHRLHPHWRVPRTGLVYEALVAAALEQRVTSTEAWTGWRRLVRRHGQVAPGPAGRWGLRVLPPAEVVRGIPSWEWLRLHVDGARSGLVVRTAERHDGLQRTLDMDPGAADRALRSLPGVGAWTSAEVRQRAHGHSDAVSFGDYHVATRVGMALVGEPIDDDQLAELLEQHRPHRYRVQRLVELSGVRKERRGARMAPRHHLPGSR